MTDEQLEKLKYPIGDFSRPKNISNDDIIKWISDIEMLPGQLSELTRHLGKEELNWRYRPDGWSLKQVVHHCADSHMNSYVRFKWTLTEDNPTIKPYFEDRWAEMPDSMEDDITGSLDLLSALHKRWVKMLKNITPEQWQRTFNHPETGRDMALDTTLSLYSWHSRHHLEHVKQALQAKGAYN